MKTEFESSRHPELLKTHRGANVTRRSKYAAQIFQPVLRPRLLPRELQGCDPLDAMLQPVVRDDLAGRAPNRFSGSLLFPVRSGEYLQRCYRKRCAPNRGESILPLANRQMITR